MSNKSLPTRERGLKLGGFGGSVQAIGGSLPTRERGLKSGASSPGSDTLSVAPYAGAWIEIIRLPLHPEGVNRRSLRGSVD